MTALADVRSERRDFAGAETLYRRALAVVETAYGFGGPPSSRPRKGVACGAVVEPGLDLVSAPQ